MSTADVVRRRTRMGEVIRGWGVVPGSVVESPDGHWLVPSAARFART